MRLNESEANVRPKEISISFSYTRLGLRSPIVERNLLHARFPDKFLLHVLFFSKKCKTKQLVKGPKSKS